MAVVAVQAGLTLTPLGGWRCPLRSVTGWPCPGCGLTRSALATLTGQWAEAIHLHLAGPAVVMLAGLLAVAAVLPSAWRGRLAARVERVERRVPVVGILAVGVVAAGVVTHLIFGAAT